MAKIQRYPILGLLGKGGMARVFRVQIPVIRKVVALKVLWPDPTLEALMGWDALETLFTNEARILGALNHPHIVGIWDFNTWQGRPYYLMDYHALNLGHQMGESPRPDEPSRIIPVERALDYTRQILKGLDRLHHSQIIHRDIKPYNMLIHGSHQIKIGDFGLSRLHGSPFSGPPHLKVGSPGYAAPEQELNPDAADARADLYSVGVILYRMLVGSLPESESAWESLADKRPDLDQAWGQFLRPALAPRRADRYPNARAMLLALDELTDHWRREREQICTLDSDGSPAASPPPRPSTQKVRHRRPAMLRRIPVKILAKKARAAFHLDPLWRPATYLRNHIRSKSPDVLQDDATGLLWQQSGSLYPYTWRETQTYVNEINARELFGRSDWRLPTIDELTSLLEPVPNGPRLCLPSVFDTLQTRLWSVDLRSRESAWYVDLELGFVGWMDFTAQLHVRCVCAL